MPGISANKNSAGKNSGKKNSESRNTAEKNSGKRNSADELELLRHAIRRRYGAAAQVENVVVPTLGGINRTLIFDLVEGAARRRLVSRQESQGAADSPFLPSSVQFRVMRIAHAHGVPVPEPVFEYEAADAMGSGYVSAFVEGETMPRKILRDAEFAVARERLTLQAGQTLALLHSIDPGELGFLEQVADSRDPLRAQRDRLDSYAEAHPAIELGLRWLERNRARAPRRTFLHGDFRTGNLKVGCDGLRAVLDWECCHIGSPAEDLGWLCTRSWRFGDNHRPVGGFGAREDLVDAYVGAGGGRIDPAEIRYWEIFGLVRWAIYNVWQAHGHVFGKRRSVTFAACGRNTSLVEYDLLMTLRGRYD
ncbi:MAG: phosphotransferase family protein [Candidatus Binataceae bacterium]